MIEIGRLCMKIAGRDAGLKCVIIDVVDDHFVVVDGQTRRKRCNVKHLEPLKQVIKINKNAPHATVVRELQKLKIEVEEKKKAEKPKTQKPVRKRKSKAVKQEASENKK